MRAQLINAATLFITVLAGESWLRETIEGVLKVSNAMYLVGVSRRLFPLALAAARRLGDKQLESEVMMTVASHLWVPQNDGLVEDIS